MNYQNKKEKILIWSLIIFASTMIQFPLKSFSKTMNTLSKSQTRISVPEYRYREYKACEKSHTHIMAELLDTRIELKNAREKQTNTTIWEKIGWGLIGAGIYGLIHESR